jgi:hypothetical protein
MRYDYQALQLFTRRLFGRLSRNLLPTLTRKVPGCREISTGREDKMRGSADYTIRLARPEDEARLAEIIVSAFGGSTLHAKREAHYGVLGGKTWQERKAW